MNPLWPGPGWDRLRDLWELDPSVHHLNHGSYGATPGPVLEAQAAWIRRAQANPNRFFHRDLDAALDEVRVRAAAFLAAPPSQLYLLSNTTTAMLAVLRSAGVGPGDRVLVTDAVYPGVLAACGAAGAATLSWPATAAETDVEAAFEHALDSRPKLAVIDHVAYTNGRLLPVESLTRAAHAAGVAVCIDGAHATGALPLAIDPIGADFYAGSFHKWCCAPPGAGFLHARGEVAAPIPGSRADQGAPAAVEWAGTHDFSPVLAIPAALDLLEEIGLDRLRAYQLALTGYAIEALNLSPPALRHPGLFAIPLGGAGADEAAHVRAEAAAAGFELSLTDGAGGWALRISAHVYNEPAEYDALAAWLAPRIRSTARA